MTEAQSDFFLAAAAAAHRRMNKKKKKGKSRISFLFLTCSKQEEDASDTPRIPEPQVCPFWIMSVRCVSTFFSQDVNFPKV